MILNVIGDIEPILSCCANRKTISNVPKNTIQIVGRKYFKNTVADEDIFDVFGWRSLDIVVVYFFDSTKVSIIR